MSRRLFTPLLIAVAALSIPTSATAQVYGGADRDVPLARFQDPLCPGVVGIQLEQAQEIVGVIRENAKMLGLRLADSETCEPNIIVAVMNDPREFLNGLMERRPYLLQELDKSQQQALLDAPGPVRSWARVEVRTRDGLMVSRREGLVQPPQATMWMAHSKIYTATRRDIISAMVLLQPAAVKGLTVAQLGDYATMRALSDHAGEQIEAPHATVLHLFDPGADKPDGLTDADWTLLRTLYSTPANDPAAITLAMANERIARGEAAE